jgi:hypothetical protein
MSAPTDAELRELLDRQAIRDCVHRYARGLDRHDDELVRRDGEWRIAARKVVIEWACAADARSSRFSTGAFPDGAWDTTDLSYRRPLTVEPDA